MLVLGGSTGIGFAVAEAALEHGAFVTISSSNQKKLDNAVARLQSHAKAVGLSPDKVSAKTCDLSKPEALDDNIINLLEFATKDGKLDHVAFTAGDALKTPSLSDVTVDLLQSMEIVRSYGTIILVKHLPKYINMTARSSFTITGGVNSWRPAPSFALLAGSGMAKEGLARGFAVALKPLRVNCVQPGAIHTELWDSLPKEQIPFLLDMFGKKSVLGKVGTPEDVAEAYLYCMKDSFTTGGVIESNGGLLVGDSMSD